MRRVIGVVLACWAAGACGDPVDHSQTQTSAGEPVRWRMTSTFSSTLPLLGTMGKRIETEIARVSGGTIELKFHEPGALAPPFETFDAVAYGAIEAGWSTSGYWAGKVPALQIFTSIPFGPSAPEYLAWFDHGGGREIFEDIYHRRNIHGVICGLSPPEASGWFKRPIDRIEDFEGLKVRFFGLGGKVLEKVGVNTQLLAGGDIFPALELGTIDGTEFSMPAVDLNMGFYQVADHYYFPGWHQQSSLFELIVNLDAWNGLTDTQRAQIETVCSANVRHGLSLGEALQVPAIKELADRGVTFHDWPPDILDRLEAAWVEVAAELAAEDEEFRRAWTSLQAFRADYPIWHDRGYLKR